MGVVFPVVLASVARRATNSRPIIGMPLKISTRLQKTINQSQTDPRTASIFVRVKTNKFDCRDRKRFFFRKKVLRESQKRPLAMTVDTEVPGWEKLNPLSERLAYLGIMGAQLRGAP